MIRNKLLRKRVFERDGGVCRVCGIFDARWEADHILELSFGGKDDLDNLQTLCRRHHRNKTSEAAPKRAKSDRLRERHDLMISRKTVSVFDGGTKNG
jgi:5-methylcytosine-specific restriction endonuclease McrA